MTSGVLIGGLGVWQGTDHRVSPYVYWLVAVLGLISAFYRTWAVEHDAKNDEHTTISAQTRQFAEQDERYKETIEALRHAEQGLKEEVARLLALQFQPRFRFVAKPWAFGSEVCDALEVWNDGAAIDLNSIRQASYIELSFAVDPSTPDADARFAASVEARYGAGVATNFGSLLEERFSPNYLQALARHEANPLGFENNVAYVPSLTDEYDVKYVGGAWDEYLMPIAKRLGIIYKEPGSEPMSSHRVAPDERSPRYPHSAVYPVLLFLPS